MIALITSLAIVVAPLLTAPFEFGVPIAAALLSVGLFVWAQLQMSSLKRTLEEHSKSDAANFAALQSSQSAILNQQASTLTSLRDIAESIRSVANAISLQAANDRDQMELLRDQASDLKILATTQASLQDRTQKLLEQTINVLAEHREE